MSFASLAYSACRAYPDDHDWLSWFSQEHLGLTGCFDDGCSVNATEQTVCNASGRSTLGLRLRFANDAVNDIAFRHAQTLGRIQQIQHFGAHTVHRQTATPGRFTLITFLCTLQNTTSGKTLIRTLQHSIRGVRRTLTPTGFTPASHQLISSPHVHFFFFVRLATARDEISAIARLPERHVEHGIDSVRLDLYNEADYRKSPARIQKVVCNGTDVTSYFPFTMPSVFVVAFFL